MWSPTLTLSEWLKTLLLVILLSCLLPGGTHGEWQDTSIFMPSTIYVGQKAWILVSTGRSAGSITFKTFVERLHQAMDDETTTSYRTEETPSGRYAVQIPYEASFLPPSGTPVELTFNFTIRLDGEVKTTSESVQVKRLSPLLLGETEKPVYRGGETVRVRFITVYTSPRTSGVPARKLTYDDKKKASVERLSEAERGELESGGFTEVYVMNPTGERVKQWLRVTPLQAANVSYLLLADAPEGDWKVTAVRSDGEQEVISFSVQKYVLPRFLVSIQPPEYLSMNSNFTQYSVCAKYTNGPAMRNGVVRSRLCVCPDNSLMNDSTGDVAVKLMQSDVCPKGWFKERPCLFTDAILSSTDGCAQFNVSTRLLELTSSEYSTWGQKVHVCAEIEEEGTKSAVVQCRLGTSVVHREGGLKLDLPEFYHGGLPVYGVVHLTSGKSTPISGADIRIEVRATTSSCFRLPVAGDTSSYHFTTVVKTDENGRAHFITSPVNSSDYQLYVKAMYSGREHGRSISFSEQRTVGYWQQLGSTSIQVWPPLSSSVSVKCPGEVRLRLLANVALSDKTLYVHSVVRGKHLMQTIPAESDKTQGESCTNRDDELGHYRCVSGGIECLSGWTGVNCIEAACEPACNPRSGSCLSGTRCVCREGWTGDRCESCVTRLGCVNGKCVDGNDCVCKTGWSGWNCNRKEIVYERIAESNETTSDSVIEREVTDKHEVVVTEVVDAGRKQPLYERDIRIKVDSDWGPKAEVVIFFYQTDAFSFSESEMVGTSFELSDLVNCTSRAISLQSQLEQSGVAFSREVASPGQSISLTIRASGSSGSISNRLTDDLSGDVCYSRISDISLDNFGGDVSLINLKTFADRVESHERARMYGWNDGTVEGAFRKAGIRVSQPGKSLPVYRTHMPCIYLRQSMVDRLEVDDEPEAMDLSNDAAPAQSEGNKGMPAPPNVKPRLRDFFPEVWHFEVNPVHPIAASGNSTKVKEYGVEKTLTVPDTLTSWRASAFCSTKQDGLWVGQQAVLKVEMPFFIELTLPKETKRGEILHLPISLFVTGNDAERDVEECLEVHVEADLNKDDWLSIGSTVYSGCVCSGGKVTYLLGVMPKRLGSVNVSVEAWAVSGSGLCMKDSSSGSGLQADGKGRKYRDRLRRSVRVVAEGVRRETTVGDILCLSKSDAEISRRFDIGLPENLVSDSLRVYVTYSDEVLGAALKNLDKLVRLPMGCGEQNMVLVAPNVYVLGYLKAVPRGDARSREKLVNRIRAHIVSGYQGQLKYQHKDGSFSAFGQSDEVGSTWLTAFVLRVFGQAYKTDASLNIDWQDLFNQTSSFLLSRQEESSGCFTETGRVLHTGMQTSVRQDGEDNKHLLMTAYVLSALVETKPKRSGDSYSGPLYLPIERALKCLHQKLETTQLNHLSTYTVAQVAKVLTQVKPYAAIARSMQEELKRRQVFSLDATMPMVYWRADDNQNTSMNGTASSDVNYRSGGIDLAANVEVTSYAYLTLSLMNATVGELLPIIRWLSSQQKSSGGFYSTQDTVLALEVIADFATRLGLSQAHVSPSSSSYTSSKTQSASGSASSLPSSQVNGTSMSPLKVSVAMWPVGERQSYLLTEVTSGTVNQMAVPSISTGDEVTSVEWSLSGLDKAVESAGCVLVQTAFIYNMEVDASDSGRKGFDLQLSLRQASPPPSKACTKSVLDICLRPGDDHQATGMLLITVDMVTGWQAVQQSLLSQVSGEAVDSLRKVEFDSRGAVFLYFDGFSREEMGSQTAGGVSSLKRCVQMTLEQTVFVESAKAAVVTAMDYYATHRQISSNYTLSSCRGAWIDREEDQAEDGKKTTTTEKPASSTEGATESVKDPPTCPQCGLKPDEVGTKTDQLFQTVCSSRTPVLLMRVLSVGAAHSNVTFTTIASNDQIASWNGSLDFVSPVKCNCEAIDVGARLVMFGGSDLQVSSGDAVVHLASTSEETVLVGVEEAMPVVEAAAERWETQQALGEVTPTPVGVVRNFPIFQHGSGWRCSRLATILRFVKFRFQ